MSHDPPTFPQASAVITIGAATTTRRGASANAGPDRAAWAVRITPPASCGTAVQWRGLLSRSTPERARQHALIEALLRADDVLPEGVPLEIHAPEPGGDLLGALAGKLCRARQVRWTSGASMDLHAKGVIPKSTGSARRELTQGAWTPATVKRSNLHLAVIWTAHTEGGRAELVEITLAGRPASLCWAPAAYPFAGLKLEFAPDGFSISGTELREIQAQFAELPAASVSQDVNVSAADTVPKRASRRSPGVFQPGLRG